MSAAWSRAAIPAPSPVLVGREAELARIEAALDPDTRQRQGGSGRAPAGVTVALVYGVAGVGKSALVYEFAARWRARRGDAASLVYRRARSEPLAVICDDLRRQLAEGPVAEVVSDEDRLADLVARLDADGTLMVLDDIHALDPRSRSELVAALAGGIRRARVLCTSRERVARGVVDPDRLEIRLDGLGADAARSLWESLDELYGAADGFDLAAARARGSPFALRRAHAGGLDDDDPTADFVNGLDADERRVAGALALASWRPSIAELSALLPDDRGRAALRRLNARLAVDVDGAERCTMHALFQDALLARMDPDEVARLHAVLATLVPRAGFDRVVETRELVRHLGGAGFWEEAGRLLVERASDLVQVGATAELLAGLGAIPAPARSAEVQLARARCLARMLDRERAYEELSRLVDAGVPPVHEIAFSFGATAFMMGRIEQSARILEGLVADPTAPAGLRTQVLLQLTWALTSMGRGEEGRRRIAEAEAAAPLEEQPLFAFYRAVSLWSDERDEELAAAVRRARVLVPEAGPPYGGTNLVPPLMAAMLARLGRPEEAREMLALADDLAKKGEDLQSRSTLQRLRGAVLLDSGDRLGAIEALRAATRAYERSGSVTTALVTGVWLGRSLMIVGRRSEAEPLLEGIARTTSSLGLAGVCAAARRALSEDPPSRLAEAERPEPPQGRHGEHVRHVALSAMRHALQGRDAEALALAAAAEAQAGAAGYGVDRALAHAARAAVAVLAGRAGEGAEHVALAQAAAAADDADADVVTRVMDLARGPVLVTGGSRSAGVRPTDSLDHFDVVIDGRSHTLRFGPRIVSLRSRPVLRRLLYALADRPNAVVSKESLATQMWSVPYNPLRHDNALWVNLRRLRVFLDGTPLEVELSQDGYRLTVPERFVFVAEP